MATEITDPRIIGQLNAGTPQSPQSPSIVIGKPAEQPTPRTIDQAAVDAANARFAGVNPNLQAKQNYKADPTVRAYEASMPIFVAALKTAPNRSGDTQLVTYAAKLSDPTTGVLGGEREQYSGASNTAERIKLFIQNEIAPKYDSNGNVVSVIMSAQTRERLRNELTRLLLARNEAYNFVREDWANTARKLNLDPSVVIGRHFGEKYKPFLRQTDINSGVAEKNLFPATEKQGDQAPKGYRFSPEDERALGDFVASDKFDPDTYARMAYEAAKRAGVNVDNAYLEGAFAEGKRIEKAKKEGRPISRGINYQNADQTYQQQLDAEIQRRNEIESDSIRASVFGPESKYYKRFQSGTGIADEVSGVTAGVAALLKGQEFTPAYEFSRDLATREFQKTAEDQASVGGLEQFTGALSELGGGVGVSALPVSVIQRAKMLSKLPLGARLLLGESVSGALLGGAYAEPEQRLRGATTGAVIAPVASATGATGQKLSRIILGGLPESTAPLSRQLLRNDIVPTPGQIGQETGGFLGRQVSNMEQALTSAPIVGPQILNRRNDAIIASNIAAGRRAVEGVSPPGVITEAGLGLREQINEIVGNAYDDALEPMRLTVDNRFRNKQQNITSRLSQIGSGDSEALKSVKGIWDSYVAPFIGPNGEISGYGLQAIKRGIMEERSKIKLLPGSRGALDIIDDINDALFDGLAKRQAPDLYQAYKKADEAYREGQIVVKAITGSQTRAGSPGIFTPSQLASQVRTSEAKYGPSAIGGSGGLSEAMTTVLPQTLPESGTAQRSLMTNLLLGGGLPAAGAGLGAITGDPTIGALLGLSAAGVASLPYSKIGNKAVANLLLGTRPGYLNAIANAMDRNSQLGRLLALPAGIDYLTPDQNFNESPQVLTPAQQSLINIYR